MQATPTRFPAPPRYDAVRIQRGDGIKGLRRASLTPRPLEAHEVRVRIHAVSLNHRDLMLVDGRAGPAGREVTPCSDASGEVLEVGAAVRSLKVGDRVFSSFFPDWLAGPASEADTARALGGTMDGVLAEQVVMDQAAWVPVPSGWSHAEASTLSCAGVTAWHALFELDPLPHGATVALLGTGGVSIWALQLAKAANLHVVMTSSDPIKKQRALALGADAVIDYRQDPDWGETLRHLSGGVDRVIDIGGQATLAQSIKALRMGGSVAVIGRLSGGTPAQFDPAELFIGSKRLIGMMVGSRTMAERLARFVERSAIRPVIDSVFDLDRLAEAFEHLSCARHMGKIVIDVSGEAQVGVRDDAL